MTTLGGNIRTIALEGKFDDCQALVKRAFADADLAAISLSSANSINIGRLLPQSVYYFHAAARIAEPGQPVVVSVPSGNFGNMMGCMIAKRMGLALERLVVPVNENDEFPVFLETGDYHKIEPSRSCLSNAMNVGHPSNLARLVALYDGHMDETGTIRKAPDIEAMRRDLFSVSVTDQTTIETIAAAWREEKLLLEPHGAVGWQGYLQYLAATSSTAPAVIVETAHPAKFPEQIEATLGFTPEVPPSLAALDDLEEHYDSLGGDYAGFKAFLKENYTR
jgi:threonine synthase